MDEELLQLGNIIPKSSTINHNISTVSCEEDSVANKTFGCKAYRFRFEQVQVQNSQKFLVLDKELESVAKELAAEKVKQSTFKLASDALVRCQVERQYKDDK